MGLDDRDYMRERNRRTFNRTVAERAGPFTPPPYELPLLVKVLCWVLMGFVVYKGYGWILEKKAQRRPAVVQPQYESEPAVQRPVSAPERQVPAPTAIQMPAYTLPPTQQIAEPLRLQTGGTIYLCRDYSGGTFWASNHCNQHQAHIERMVSVPPGMPFEQQVQLAEQRRQALTSTTTTWYETSSALPPNQISNNKALCESLDARVTQLDSMARNPQSGAMQDWIRTERQKTRDEQFRLHC